MGLDQKYFVGAQLGDSVIAAVGAADVATQLKPGRYLIYPVDLAGGTLRCWVRQNTETVLAAAAAPSTLMGDGALTAVELVVRDAPINSYQKARDFLHVIGDAGVTGELHIVRISRSTL